MRSTYFAPILILLAVQGLPAASHAVTIGTPDPRTGNCIPFGCQMVNGDSGRYQQVYSADRFPGAIPIAEIRFFMTELVGGNLATADLTLTLSTTAAAVGSLSTNFDSNVGSDAQLFAAVRLNGGPAPAVFSFSGTPFDYDPAEGNLLLDIVATNYDHPTCLLADFPNPSPTCAYYDNQNVSGNFSRATDWDAPPLTDEVGLVTEFVPVPEPSTALLVVAGLVGLGARPSRPSRP